jgi:hypothetical protein
MAMESFVQSRVRYNFTTDTLLSLVQQLDGGDLDIPDHQRDYCWPIIKAERFIESVMRSYPIPSIIISQGRTDPKPSIEDGRQRITTASMYRNNNFPCKGKFFRDLTEREQDWFDNYQMSIIKYSNFTQEDRIKIFDWFQNGAPLSTGERYHAHASTFLVKFVKDTFFTPGMGLHDRAIPIWGARNTNDKRRKWLQSAVALVVGLAHGMSHMTKKYEYMICESHNFLTKEFDTDAVTRDIERILEIFEEADRVHRVNRWQNTNWDAGNFIGYIAYSLSHKSRINHPIDEPIKFDDGFHKPNSISRFPGEWERIKMGWVNYICKVRRQTASSTLKQALETGVHRDLSSARSWSLMRWKYGYLRVFEPNIFAGQEFVDEDDSSDDDSTD